MAELKPEFRKIRNVSFALLWIACLTFLSISIMIVVVEWQIINSPTASGENFFDTNKAIAVTSGQIREGLLTLWDKTIISAVILLVMGLVLPGLYFCIRLLQNFRDGIIFAAINIRLSRLIAWLYLLFVVSGLLVGLYVAWSPDGFNFSFNPLLFSSKYLVLGLLWLIVWILEIGTALQLDSDMTI